MESQPKNKKESKYPKVTYSKVKYPNRFPVAGRALMGGALAGISCFTLLIAATSTWLEGQTVSWLEGQTATEEPGIP